MIASTTPGTHNPRINAQTVTNRLREIGERLPYTMYVLYAAFLFWPSIYLKDLYGFFENTVYPDQKVKSSDQDLHCFPL